jgi:hypothetical protein
LPLRILTEAFSCIPSAQPEDYLANPMTLLGLRGHPYYFNMSALVQFVAQAQPMFQNPGAGPTFFHLVPQHERDQAKSRRKHKTRCRSPGWKQRAEARESPGQEPAHWDEDLYGPPDPRLLRLSQSP